MVSTFKKIILAASISSISLQAQATLTSYNPNGVDLVYSSVSNVTWTKDGNLLGTMFASQGFSTVVNNILSVSPYTLSSNDFSDGGYATWFGAMAFINYLNTTNYGGSNQWRLPSFTDTGYPGVQYGFNGTDGGLNTYTNGTVTGNEFAELYYQELGSKGNRNTNGTYQPDSGIKDLNNTFNNEVSSYYWLNTSLTDYKYYFNTSTGYQGYSMYANNLFSVWAISPGQVSVITTEPPTSPVPEADNLSMLLVGLGLVSVAKRHIKKA